MENNDPLSTKSYEYAVNIGKLSLELSNRRYFVLADQLLRSGTSIAANIKESKFAQSKADFISKLSISLKEANENEFWLDLLRDMNVISIENHDLFKRKCVEIQYILISCIKAAKKSRSTENK